MVKVENWWKTMLINLCKVGEKLFTLLTLSKNVLKKSWKNVLLHQLFQYKSHIFTQHSFYTFNLLKSELYTFYT